jgi:hypothetical protein
VTTTTAQSVEFSDRVTRDRTLLAIIAFALLKVVFHLLTNDGYGFHRDELATIDDAKHLAWGYVAYPPLTAFFADATPAALRFLPSLAQSLVIILSAAMARRFGGGKAAQWIAAGAVAVSPISLSASALYQYVAFDFLWWVLIAFLVVRLVDSQDPRWWVPIGAVIGLAALTKYTVIFLVAGLAVGFFTSSLRKQITSRWLWGGAILSILIALPHLLWQMQNDFITLDFLESIHARDVRIGRTDSFIADQFLSAANPVTIPLWIAGLGSLFFSARLRRFRILGLMAVVPFILFVIAKGRGYYMAPVYPMLLATGSAELERWLQSRSQGFRRSAWAAAALLLIVGSGVAVVALPIAPIGTDLWRTAAETNSDLAEEVGWPELTAEVARIWKSLPEEERRRTAIFCSNYGEAGAINLYGPAHGLPAAISNVNSYWQRGYGNPPPETLIVLGSDRETLEGLFESVVLAGRTPAPFGVKNEETERHPEIFVARGFRGSWAELWKQTRGFG